MPFFTWDLSVAQAETAPSGLVSTSPGMGGASTGESQGTLKIWQESGLPAKGISMKKKINKKKIKKHKMCVCIYIYICVCVCKCIYICVCVCVLLFIYC